MVFSIEKCKKQEMSFVTRRDLTLNMNRWLAAARVAKCEELSNTSMNHARGKRDAIEC